MDYANFSLQPAILEDFNALARLENDVFWDEEFSALAFGPQRGSDVNISLRAASMAAVDAPGKRSRYIKAVVIDENTGQELVLGFAGWSFVTRKHEEGQRETVVEEEKSEEQLLKANEKAWGPGANFHFCVDAFCSADDEMLKGCEDKDYAKLNTLVVSPKYQRKGVGTKLLEEGLREIDEFGLQAVLGASPEGEGLYKRYGFIGIALFEHKLSDYEGGQGMKDARHVVMHRPAKV